MKIKGYIFIAVRAVCGGLLCCAVYEESGPVTALAFLALYIGIETVHCYALFLGNTIIKILRTMTNETP